jgi:2-aminoethylphosphonate-pyruvate transaminase
VIAEDPAITHVAVVHCETSTGIMNPIREIGHAVREAGRTYIVDAMSSFAACRIDLPGWGIGILISSANKCIEGIPGFSFVLAERKHLEQTEGIARSLSLDLVAQWRGLEADGQFRFTPPTHALLAFDQALNELSEEGGVLGREARYRDNHATLVAGMERLGFRPYIRPELQSHIITAFHNPTHPRFDFDDFYARLHARGMIVYSGKVGHASTFRIGNIGRIFRRDVEDLLASVQELLDEMGVTWLYEAL